MKAFILFAAFAAPLLAQDFTPAYTSPYHIESSCQANLAGFPFATWNLCMGLDQASCQSFNQCWWRNTSYQNELADHTVSDFTGQLIHPFAAFGFDVWVWSAHEASNTILLLSGTDAIVIGTAGSEAAVAIAWNMFTHYVPNFGSKTLSAILYLDADYTSYFGSDLLASNHPNLQVYASADFPSVLQTQIATQSARQALTAQMQGWGLPWGADGFLGMGTAYGHPTAGGASGMLNPTNLVAQNDNVDWTGPTVSLIRSIRENAGLTVWIPDHKIVIRGAPFGRYLPDVAP